MSISIFQNRNLMSNFQFEILPKSLSFLQIGPNSFFQPAKFYPEFGAFQDRTLMSYRRPIILIVLFEGKFMVWVIDNGTLRSQNL